MTTPLEPLYVVDTNVLLWHLTQSMRLSARVSMILAAAERGETSLVVSAIVLAELYYANRKFGLFADFAQVYARLASLPYIQFAPFDPEAVLRFAEDEVIPEMHDRIIFGLARHIGAPLLTSDQVLRQAASVVTVW